ncbi:hypothetical protein [Candidatus Tisiphia endosymbiont of Ditula angustiorana]|uniref:hypothetical protein n=1 Tax=Candidatus Tisiphia endosymbiont of Ditula angustiorana TaxID=3066272 RepID=UPI00312C99F2
MSLRESEETLSAIKQLQEKIKVEQEIFGDANKERELLQKDLVKKQVYSMKINNCVVVVQDLRCSRTNVRCAPRLGHS